MTGLVLFFIINLGYSPAVPSGPSLENSPATAVHPQSACPTSEPADDPAPEPDSPDDVFADEIEPVDNFETPAPVIAARFDFWPPIADLRFHSSSIISVPPSPAARSPQLRC